MNLLQPAINLLPLPSSVIKDTYEALNPYPQVLGNQVQLELLQIKNFQEDQKIQERVQLIAARAHIGPNDLAHYRYHTTESDRIFLNKGNFEPYKIILPLQQAVAYGAEPDETESPRRMGKTAEEHKELIHFGDLALLEKIFYEDSYFVRSLASLGVAVGAGLMTCVIASPGSALALAGFVGLSALSATHILICSVALTALSLAAYKAIRSIVSQTSTLKATRAMIGLGDVRTIDQAASLAVSRLEKQREANKTVPSLFALRIVHGLKYTAEGELRSFRTWDSSIAKRTALLQRLRQPV